MIRYACNVFGLYPLHCILLGTQREYLTVAARPCDWSAPCSVGAVLHPISVTVTTAYAKMIGAAVSVEHKRAGRSDTRAASQAPASYGRDGTCLPPGTNVLDLWLSVLCMRSKAWLAARISLRLARIPRTARTARRSRRQRSTLAAAPGLLAHTEVAIILFFSMVPTLRYPVVEAYPH